VNLLYVSRDYTTHDRRFLGSFAAAGHVVSYVRLEQTAVTFDARQLPVGVQQVPWPMSDPRRRLLVDDVARVREMKRVVRRVTPDAIVAGPLQTASFMVAAAAYRPFIAMSWGSDILVDADRSFASRCLTKFALSRSSGVLGDCRAVREKVHALVPYADDRIVTFPWGIDLDDFKPSPPRLSLRSSLGWDDKVVFISTRTWEPAYAIDVLVRAFATVSRRSADVRLLLMGDGSLDAMIRGLIAEEGLESVVHAPGRIGYEQLPEYFRSADVYVSSALSDGTSISLLEAMACALPVVATNGYGNLEWVVPGVNGWLVTPGDPSSMADALLDAAADRDRRRQFGATNASLAKERADWTANFPQLLRLLDRVTAES
jgi:glycosyltransferase involved in cell wall biosynthesis